MKFDTLYFVAIVGRHDDKKFYALNGLNGGRVFTSGYKDKDLLFPEDVFITVGTPDEALMLANVARRMLHDPKRSFKIFMRTFCKENSNMMLVVKETPIKDWESLQRFNNWDDAE